MQNGDISNALPPRFLVTLDVITDEYVDEQKLWRIIPIKRTKTHYNRLVLSHLYVTSLKRGWTLELIGYGKTDEEMVEVMQYLDQYGTNPFRYASGYKSIDALVSQLPYRPEIAGVIDMPTNLLRYGSWGMDFPRL